MMMKLLASVLALSLLAGCAEYEQQGRTIIDRAGALEARGPCLVRMGTKVRMAKIKGDALDAYTAIMCAAP